MPDISEEVALDVQEKLIVRGYAMHKTPDGVLDEGTLDRIEQYRIDQGLRPVRAIDDEFLTLLDDVGALRPT